MGPKVMTIRGYVLLLLAAGTLSLASCNGKCTCVDADGLSPTLISFSSSDADSFVIKKFTKGSNFSSLLDSILIDTSNSLYQRNNDTTEVISGNATLSSKFDYQIILLSSNNVISISDIDEPQTQGNCSEKIQCVNPINSYKINGNLVMNQDPYIGRIYIQQ
jgi:hypothetical protein